MALESEEERDRRIAKLLEWPPRDDWVSCDNCGNMMDPADVHLVAHIVPLCPMCR
jgi:hypothetical protein